MNTTYSQTFLYISGPPTDCTTWNQPEQHFDSSKRPRQGDRFGHNKKLKGWQKGKQGNKKA